MTTQYIVGEFSALLGDLLPVPDDLLCGALRDLQREVEASSVSRLRLLARRAISLTDVICWVTLERGDMTRFCRDGPLHFDSSPSAPDFYPRPQP